MPYTNLRALISNPFSQVVISLAVGLAIGISQMVLPPIIAPLLLIAAIGAAIALKFPETILIANIIGYSTIMDVNAIPLIPIGFGSLNLLDLGLVGLLALVAVRRAVQKDFTVQMDALGVSLMIFLGMMLLSTVLGLITGTTVLDQATTEIRYVGYYASYFVVSHLIQGERQLQIIIRTFLMLAVFVAVMMVAQFLVGYENQIIYGRIEEFAQDGTDVEGIARIIPAGRYLILVGFMSFTALLAFPERAVFFRRTRFLAWLMLGIGILLTFNRNFWVSSAIVTFLFLVVLDSRRRSYLIMFMLRMAAIAFVVIGGIFVVAPESELAATITTIVGRFTSTFKAETFNARYDNEARTSSLEWRRIENEYAMEYIWPPRIFGLGMGAAYRPVVPELDDGDIEQEGIYYIHNSHFWIMIKTGIVGYLALLSFKLIAVGRGVVYWRKVRVIYSPIVMGFSISLVGILFSAIVDPILTDLTWTPIAGLIIGLNEVIIRTQALEPEEAEAPEPSRQVARRRMSSAATTQ
ncbi:MAG: O-antigen ligase family protein [Anaerolineae bacterium]|nr:O-antigen ligase family protein [Anaerolineae bacterium]MCA9887377.1 O-antigen ligase family protein [Anaerolineae bacterium]